VGCSTITTASLLERVVSISGQNGLIETLLDGPLSDAAYARVERMTATEVEEIEFLNLHPADNFDDANIWGKRVQANVLSYTVDQLRTILLSSAENRQILGSFQLPHTLAAIKKTKAAATELAPLIAAYCTDSSVDFHSSGT
jgi:hypothetical protein